MDMMRALLMDGFGLPSQARIDEVPVPAIGAGDVLVRIAAVSLNPVDWKEMAGMLAGFYPPYPPRWIPGFDASGIVAAVGSTVDTVAVGDRVLARPDRATGNGVLAEYAKVPADKVARMPAGMSHAEIACIATTVRTAWQALRRPDVGVVRAGDTVFVDGASGGVGSAILALAHALGARVGGSCRPANADYVRGLGAEVALDYRAPDFAAQVRGWAPQGVDVIVDCNNGGQKLELIDLLAPGGRLIALATLNNDGDVAAATAMAQAQGKTFHFLLMDYDRLATDIAELTPVLKDGRLPPPAIATYPFAQTVDALVAVAAGQVRGKIVVEVQALP